MIQEAIEKVQQMVRDEKRMQVVVVDREPKDVFWLVDKDGKAERKVAEPAPRSYTATSLTGFCHQLSHFATPGNKIAVFVGRGCVTALLDEETRRDRITLKLRETQAFQFLAAAQESAKVLSQKDLIWELRTRFRSQVAPADFLADIRQLRFRSGDEGEATVQTGNESLRRNVQASVVAGGKDIAEAIDLDAAVYEGTPEIEDDTSFRVAVDMNLSEQKFQLRTLPGESESALLATHEKIREYILGTVINVRVFVDSAVA